MANQGLGGNWEADRRKRESAAKRRAADIADAKRIDGLERQRAADLAQAHRHESAFFESVATQIDEGHAASPKQAATLLKIAVEKGWSTRAANKSSAPAGTSQGNIERELRDDAGDEPELQGYAERCRAGAVLSQKERGRANWLLSQEGLR